MTSRARVQIEDGVATVTLDDGKVNALSTPLMNELAAALDAAEAAQAIVVLEGRDDVFSAGFDLGTFRRGREATLEMLRTGAGLIERLLAFPRPVVAVCRGHAYPMGAFLLLASDVRLGAAGEHRIGLNESAIGITIPWFAIELARHRLSPPGFSRVASGAMFSPEEAARLGYLDAVIPRERLDAVVRAEAERLRTLHDPSFAATKARANAALLAALRAAVASELGAAAAA